MKLAICPGSFDPVTIGHLDIIGRARKIFDHVIVAVMVNPEKHTMFTTEERIALIQKCTKDMEDVEVVSFDGLLADYAKMRGATAIVKGLRACPTSNMNSSKRLQTGSSTRNWKPFS